jgi:protein-disulfide isomerase
MANNDKWVDDRLHALTPPATWKPDATAALGRVREREKAYRKHRAQWVGSAMAASLLGLAVLLTPAKCAFGVCRTPAPAEQPVPAPSPAVVPIPAPAAQITPAPAAPRVKHSAAVPAEAPQVTRNFKETGNPAAPITCEIFTDYECPHCATIYDQIVPMMLAEYVQTGKMKVVHRDFPLPMHAHARLAARYANAAGRLGQYELVVNQIFRTQPVWARTGDVDSQVAQMVTPEIMEKIRAMVQNDGQLDETVISDLALAREDNLNQTPSLVISYKGKRQVIAPVPPYSFLKSYLDELLTK